MAKIIIDEHDDTTPYGIAGDAFWHGDVDVIWFDKQELIDLRNQINDILNESAE